MSITQNIIIDCIPEGARVLDLGCGDGTLLERAIAEKNVTGYGIDNQFSNIQQCVAKGLSVYQGNLNEGLQEFRPHSFDLVILSLTLQEVMDPVYLLKEMLRVGKQVIITFPNFGFWAIRLQYLLTGNTPKNRSLPYEWYNTPNIRILTIRDFKQLCKKESIRIQKEFPLFNARLFRKFFPKSLTNLCSQKGVFLISS